MTSVNVVLDIDDWQSRPQVPKENIVNVQEGVQIVRIPKGMESGASCVAVVAPLPDGKLLFLEMSLANLQLAMAAIQGAESRGQPDAAKN